MSKLKLPPLTKEPVKHVDMTPDKNLPLRILQAYRSNCDCMWSDNIGGEETKNPLLAAMNEHNRQRAKILDKAIKKLGGIYD